MIVICERAKGCRNKVCSHRVPHEEWGVCVEGTCRWEEARLGALTAAGYTHHILPGVVRCSEFHIRVALVKEWLE